MALKSARAGMSLTAREVDVIRLMAEGCINSEIGDKLGISTETVKTHLKRIFRKLSARNRAHVVAQAIRQKLI